MTKNILLKKKILKLKAKLVLLQKLINKSI